MPYAKHAIYAFYILVETMLMKRSVLLSKARNCVFVCLLLNRIHLSYLTKTHGGKYFQIIKSGTDNRTFAVYVQHFRCYKELVDGASSP